MRKNDIEGRWQIGAATLRKRVEEGRARAGEFNRESQQHGVVVLKDKEVALIQSRFLTVQGRDQSGALDVVVGSDVQLNREQTARTIWVRDAHDASVYGSTLLRSVLPDRKFPFPKSLYAVEDTLRFFVKDKQEAVVLDFFSGSGTTAHAVMRLNKQDDGLRQCISVTNNEVSSEEQTKLRRQGLRPGDADWEKLGICDYITKPRITAAITGTTPHGQPITGDYKFTDEFPMSEGFEENAVFFTLTYEAPLTVRHNRAFARIAPILWLRAGSQGRIITNLDKRGWDVAESYAVLENLDQVDKFVAEVLDSTGVRTAFIITDDDSAFQMVCRELPKKVAPIRLYESYLQNFEINIGRSL